MIREKKIGIRNSVSNTRLGIHQAQKGTRASTEHHTTRDPQAQKEPKINLLNRVGPLKFVNEHLIIGGEIVLLEPTPLS